MTEQEAIKILTLNKKEQEKLPNLKKVYAVAITALEEIKQYRAIGTVEECREATEKQRAKMPLAIVKSNIENGGMYGDCPRCGEHMESLWTAEKFCPKCRQRIDWSE